MTDVRREIERSTDRRPRAGPAAEVCGVGRSVACRSGPSIHGGWCICAWTMRCSMHDQINDGARVRRPCGVGSADGRARADDQKVSNNKNGTRKPYTYYEVGANSTPAAPAHAPSPSELRAFSSSPLQASASPLQPAARSIATSSAAGRARFRRCAAQMEPGGKERARRRASAGVAAVIQ